MRLKSVSFCSSPSMIIRPRKNQWRLCSLQDKQGTKTSLFMLLQIKDTLSFGVYSLETTHTCWTEPDQSILHWWDSFSLSGRVYCSSPDPKSQTPTLFKNTARQTNRQQPDKYEMKKKMIRNEYKAKRKPAKLNLC